MPEGALIHLYYLLSINYKNVKFSHCTCPTESNTHTHMYLVRLLNTHIPPPSIFRPRKFRSLENSRDNSSYSLSLSHSCKNARSLPISSRVTLLPQRDSRATFTHIVAAFPLSLRVHGWALANLFSLSVYVVSYIYTHIHPYTVYTR